MSIRNRRGALRRNHMENTEIDWNAYMEQVSQYVSGERDYTLIKGGTGPLVYPAAHVYIYTGLYYLTNKGKDIFLAQQLFGVLYMATLALVMACYRKAKVGYNVKKTFGIVLFLGRGFTGALKLAMVMAQIQFLIAYPFLGENAIGYLSRAFELSRQFLFKWTVNWRFVGEDVFLSRPFSITLLVMHVSVLVWFITNKWLRPTRKPLSAIIGPVLQLESPFSPLEESQVASRVTPEFVMTTILSANAIGLLFARSLHYQFYSYVAWSTPYLLWRSGINPVFQYGLWALQEWAWNVYPSTPVSSSVAVAVLSATVALIARAK
ncbi:hypothetical protein DL765_006950 [Monosporascus sp. GIB2]|nr:hypothetical protein DL765_006950 [Monosporascus sp. GIB2]